jgi:hypothetical protein
VARYVACYGGGGRVAKAVLIGAIPPVLLKSASNPDGVPADVIDGIRTAGSESGKIDSRRFTTRVLAAPVHG